MPRPLPVRGVIEGFYGPPWERDARLAMLDFLSEHGMNAYVYAPKSDPRHRDRWRESYDDEDSGHFRTLASRARACGVRFGFAISPGLDVDYHDDGDRAALAGKLVPLVEIGVSWIVLALDDIPSRPGLARDQAALAGWLLEALRARDAGVRLSLVPTEYVGTRPTPYLCDLAEALPPDVEDIMWTGPTVCSPTISAGDARSWAAALGGRRPLLWDNYPVNDGPMERSLHLGPYRGRAPDLADELAGVLCNPMLQPWASRVALATAADYLADPAGYDPAASWERAVTGVGGTRAGALSAMAAACADGPLSRPEELEAHRLVTTLTDGAPTPADVAATRDHFGAVREATRAWVEAAADPLGLELEPWLTQARHETAAALAALELLDLVADTAPGDVDAERALLCAFGVIFTWDRARNGTATVFGPRFAITPAVVQLGDGRAALDVDLAVTEDRNAVDRLCRHALRGYRTWTETVG
ncbi:MAG TPA: protein O-GlcNAcase [Acidimicrobiia bacterium]